MPRRFSLYAALALPVPVNRTFTYAVPDELAGDTCFGCRVLVPFGRRLVTGFVTGLSDNPGDVPLSKIKAVTEVIDDEPVFDGHMLALAEWIADYYLSSVGEVLKTAMPLGTMMRSRIRITSVNGQPESETLSDRQREVLEAVWAHESVLLKTLEREFDTPISSLLRALEHKGLITLTRELTGKTARPRTIRHVRLSDMEAAADTRSLSSRAREQKRCIEILAGLPDGLPIAELMERHGLSRGVINAVVKSGRAEFEEREAPRISEILTQDDVKTDHALTDEQTQALEIFREESAKDTPRPILVKGVTGSGKTRLYIEIVRDALSRGKGAIILVPEISLTPQTTRFFTSAFPGHVAVMHSAMSPGERFDMWRMINEGKRDVVIGPRSAVFAPLADPGVIIVDEEHDGSYKQTDTSPRYHARDTAVVRAHIHNIPAVLGSATPSLESWYNARIEKYRLCILSQRVQERPMPLVMMVDMRGEREAENFSSLSRLLRDELAARNNTGEKSILLINRRGFSSGVRCGECGNVLMCPHCATALTYHMSKGLALCHICGHSQLVLEHCPHCGSTDLRYRGSGTQKIEKELYTVVPESSVLRMDSDTTSVKNAHHRLLEEFRSADKRVLIGTQMVAKGLDIPEITLVGIISADTSLFLPDFRAGERTFQLITQVAGRAGRGEKPGTVIVQTNNPDNYALKNAIAQDYDSFVEEEIETRESVGFPPLTRLVLIETSAKNRGESETAGQTIADYLARYAPEDIEVLGPAEAPIPRVRGRFRYHVLIKGDRIPRVLPLIRYTVDRYQSRTTQVTVDVDPVDLL